MEDRFERLELLIGKDALDRLKASRVAVFGIGGVGGYVTEALARSGVGSFVLVDNDVVSVTNLNRQIIALDSTIGKYKVDVMADRIHDINPDAPEKSNFVVTLSGADMPSAVSKAKSMLAFKSPSLAMLKLDKGEVTSVDLKSLVDMPFTMDAMLTDSDLILGTPGNDVKAISALPKATDGRIMSIMLNGNINQILKKAGVDEISLPPGCQVQLSFGVSATGPEMTSSVKFSK